LTANNSGGIVTIKHLARFIWIGLLISTPGWLSAQNSPGSDLGAASLGIVYDSAIRGVRPLIGVAGAATMTKPLGLGFEVKSVSVPPREDYVLAVAAEDSSVRLITFRGRVAELRALPGLDSAPDRIDFSPTGASAAIYYAAAGKVQVVTDLPSHPSATGRDISMLGSPVTALAISDDGARLIVGSANGDSAAAYLLNADNSLAQTVTLSEATAAVLGPRGSTAYLVDRKQNSVFKWQASTGVFSLVAGAADGISGPVAAGVSRDSRRLFVANAGARTITALDLITGERSSVECGCTPSGLYRLNGSATFRLTDVKDGVIWVLEGEPRARIVFIPLERPIAERNGPSLWRRYEP
jgi:WD40 repeat protein